MNMNIKKGGRISKSLVPTLRKSRSLALKTPNTLSQIINIYIKDIIPNTKYASPYTNYTIAKQSAASQSEETAERN